MTDITSQQSGGVRALSDRLTQIFAPPQRLALKASDELGNALRKGGVGDFDAASPFAACLMPLLDVLGWHGSMRELMESLPHFANDLDLMDLRNVLAHLGFDSHELKAQVHELDPRLFPAMVRDEKGHVLVILRREEQGFLIFDADAREERHQKTLPQSTDILIFKARDQDGEEEQIDKSWMSALAHRFKRTIGMLFASTFVLNILSLIVPIYIMVIYDQVIPSHSTAVLGYLALGVGIALVIEMGFRILRARLIAYMGGRIENLVANATFAQILNLPPQLTETASVGAQAARLREFDSIRDVFTGPLVSVGLELPFVILFLAVIAMLGGSLAFIPVVMMGLYILIGLALLPSLKRHVKGSSRARAKRHGFLVEMLTNARTIKQLAAETIWSERYRDLSAQASLAHFKTAQMSFLLQTLAQAIMMGAGIATIGFGVLFVVEGQMTIGALIATMALVWRVLSPLQNLFLALTRFEQIKLSFRQINQLMAMPVERKEFQDKKIARQFLGDVAFDRVSFRYRPDAEPALMGVNFSLAAGQSLAIMGKNGSGKTTILNMIAGLYRPQAGLVTIDGVDIRQIDPIELRQTIAYVPQDVQMFHGTLAQNLRLGQPTASDGDLNTACAQVGILDQILALPKGFDTRVGDQSLQQLNYGFRQSLAIARALLRKSPIILLDEAARSLDDEADKAFMALLKNLKGQATVIMVSHRPSHIRLCDQAMILDSGVVRGVGSAQDVLASMNGGQI